MHEVHHGVACRDCRLFLESICNPGTGACSVSWVDPSLLEHACYECVIADQPACGSFEERADEATFPFSGEEDGKTPRRASAHSDRKLPENDAVNHPAHYCAAGVYCLEVLKAVMTPAQYEGFLRGNVMKYLWRYNKKNGVEDLRKARVYLDELIDFAAGVTEPTEKER